MNQKITQVCRSEKKGYFFQKKQFFYPKPLQTKNVKTVLLIMFSLISVGMCSAEESKKSEKCIVFAQLTDPQIGIYTGNKQFRRPDYNGDLASFAAAVAAVNKIDVNFSLVCGDLVQSPTKNSFRDISRVIKEFKNPVYIVPGNHDAYNRNTLKMFKKFIGPDRQDFTAGGLAFVLLNSELIKKPFEPEYSEQLLWLKERLNHYSQKKIPIVIVMHHPPFLKQLKEKENPYNLPVTKRAELLKQFKQNGVIAVLYGHTHKIRNEKVDGIIYAAAPTTSINFDRQPHGFFLWKYDGKELSVKTINLKEEKESNTNIQKMK